jgi:hypothetical protein
MAEQSNEKPTNARTSTTIRFGLLRSITKQNPRALLRIVFAEESCSGRESSGQAGGQRPAESYDQERSKTSIS